MLVFKLRYNGFLKSQRQDLIYGTTTQKKDVLSLSVVLGSFAVAPHTTSALFGHKKAEVVIFKTTLRLCRLPSVSL